MGVGMGSVLLCQKGVAESIGKEKSDQMTEWEEVGYPDGGDNWREEVETCKDGLG